MSTVVFGWTDPVLGVDVPSEWVDAVVALFPHYRLDTGRAPRTVHLLPGKEGGTLRTERGDADAESDQDLMSLVEFEITRALLEARSELVHLHASGAVVSGRAVLALGPAGAGKSSLGLAWHRAGLSLLGDDVVLIDADGSARGFRRLMKLEHQRVREGGIDPVSTLAFDPENPEVWHSPGPEGWADGPVPVAVVARVRFEAGAPLQLRPLSRSETLNVLVHSLLASGLPGAESVGSVTEVAQGAVGLDVRFSDSTVAAEALAAEVDGS